MPNYLQHFLGLEARKSYSSKNALSLAVACELAYQPKGVVESTAKQSWGYPNAEFLSVSKGNDIDTQGFVMSDARNTVVVFRGSASLQDWFANFQAVRDPGPLGKNYKKKLAKTLAHEGFQDALYPSVLKFTEILDRFRDKEQKIWISGHSLGAALGSLYAGMLIENGYPVYGIYTYASPRPGDGKFAEQLNASVDGPHFRIVNSGDIVPHVPPEPFFSHAGKRKILTNKCILCSKKNWLDQRISALKVFIRETGNRFDIGDNHRLSADAESYIPRLIRLRERGQ